MTANKIFNNDNITKKMVSRLNKIKKLNLEKGLLYIQNSETSMYTSLPREDFNTLMVKVDKKKNLNNAIDSIRDDLCYILNIDMALVNIAYDIKSYNNVIYIKRKY